MHRILILAALLALIRPTGAGIVGPADDAEPALLRWKPCGDRRLLGLPLATSELPPCPENSAASPRPFFFSCSPC